MNIHERIESAMRDDKREMRLGLTYVDRCGIDNERMYREPLLALALARDRDHAREDKFNQLHMDLILRLCAVGRIEEQVEPTCTKARVLEMLECGSVA